MKILLVSDNHGDSCTLRKIVMENPNVDVYLHCGDSELSEDEIRSFLSVKGNCDYFSNFKNQILFDTSLGKMMMRHSPIISDFEKDNLNIKIYLHGHTHVKRFEKIDDVYYINPGSTSRPRDGYQGSYAIIEINENNLNVEFKFI